MHAMDPFHHSRMEGKEIPRSLPLTSPVVVIPRNSTHAVVVIVIVIVIVTGRHVH